MQHGVKYTPWAGGKIVKYGKKDFFSAKSAKLSYFRRSKLTERRIYSYFKTQQF
jgi:hypothetical protein